MKLFQTWNSGFFPECTLSDIIWHNSGLRLGDKTHLFSAFPFQDLVNYATTFEWSIWDTILFPKNCTLESFSNAVNACLQFTLSLMNGYWII